MKLKTQLSLLLLLASAANLLFAADPPTDEDGFHYAVPGAELTFPRDHGSHPDFKTEWWYVTGQLASEDRSIDLGFQLTFFRSASKSDPSAQADQIYMAHAAVTDKNKQLFHHEERLNAADWNADAAVGALDLYNGNWYLRMLDANTEKMSARFSLASVGVFNLTLDPQKPKTLFGENGYSQKGDATGAASYYITFTRLSADGALERPDGGTVNLSGQAWMDHEYSSSQLTENQIGWNWTSLILEDGTELMAYVMRRSDGQVDPHSRLTLISPSGQKTEWSRNAFEWTPTRFWESPQSGARYPVAYEISWPSEAGTRSIEVRPYLDDQELTGKIGAFVYWEGASQAFDEAGKPIGSGYTELTGYAESLYGKF